MENALLRGGWGKAKRGEGRAWRTCCSVMGWLGARLKTRCKAERGGWEVGNENSLSLERELETLFPQSEVTG